MMYSLGDDNILCVYELKDKEFELQKERLNIGISFGEIYLYNENKLIKVSILDESIWRPMNDSKT